MIICIRNLVLQEKIFPNYLEMRISRNVYIVDHFFERKNMPPSLGRKCEKCNGRLVKTGVRFGETVPQEPLNNAIENSKKCDLALVLGSSMTVGPFCNLPPLSKNMVVVSITETPVDKECKLKINNTCDVVMRYIMKKLGIKMDPCEYKQEYEFSHSISSNKLTFSVNGVAVNEPITCIESISITDVDKKLEKELEKDMHHSYHVEFNSTDFRMFKVHVKYQPEFKASDNVFDYNVDKNESKSIQALKMRFDNYLVLMMIDFCLFGILIQNHLFILIFYFMYKSSGYHFQV